MQHKTFIHLTMSTLLMPSQDFWCSTGLLHVISNCSTAFLQYSIASDCGACPTHTNTTTATCSDLWLSPNAIMCQFSVSSHACGLVGNPTSPIAVTLKGIILLLGMELVFEAHCTCLSLISPKQLTDGWTDGRTDGQTKITKQLQ